MNVDIENAVHKLEEIQNYDDDLIETATISNNLQYIVFGGHNKCLKIWDYQTNSSVKHIRMHGIIIICKFTDDSTLLYVGTTIALYLFVVHSKFKLIFKYKLLKDYITNIYCISNAMLLTSSNKGMINKYNTISRQSLFQIQAFRQYFVGFDYNKDYDLISCVSDKTVKIWNGVNRSLLIKKKTDDYCLAQVFFISHEQLITLDFFKQMKIWNINYKKKKLENYKIIDYGVFNASLIQNQYIITVGCQCIKIYTNEGKYIKQFDYDKKGILRTSDSSYNIIQLNTMKAVLIKGRYSLQVCKFK